ncbi:MAG: retron Ec78 anti-phage system effector HNH endonuclease PtuB [Pseudomonadota bacterium]
MHKLERDPAPPTGLANYQHGQHTWGSHIPKLHEREQIWKKLDAMQGKRCAYCEAAIDKENRHIEHFRQRSRYPQGTFAWNNLFGSCNRKNTCGDHKDRCGDYDYRDLIKPDIEDPEHYLLFSSTGTVSARNNLDAAERHRADQTLRILNLNGPLRQIRHSELAGYVQTAEEFARMAQEFAPSEWLPLLLEELNTVEALPYATAIRHILTG